MFIRIQEGLYNLEKVVKVVRKGKQVLIVIKGQTLPDTLNYASVSLAIQGLDNIEAELNYIYLGEVFTNGAT